MLHTHLVPGYLSHILSLSPENMILCRKPCPTLWRLSQQSISRTSSQIPIAPKLHYIRPFTSTTNPGSNNYYDSQSGMHVDIHNEDKISVFAHADALKLALFESELNQSNLTTQKFQAHITFMQQSGFSGSVLTNNNKTAFVLNDVVPDVPPEFSIFVPNLATIVHTTTDHPSYPQNIHGMFEYIAGTTDDDRRLSSLTNAISEHVANGTKTAIAVVDYDHDPILIANDVATLIDNTGGGDTVWLSGRNSNFFSSLSSKKEEKKKATTTVIDPDTIVTLCEELSYLDISGSTMKSRITVDLDLLFVNPTATEEEEAIMAVEECLMMGINKFFIRKERLKWFQEILQRHGKGLRTAHRK